ncbi:MAG: M20/M25/M40 family metallo-hydrolase [Thermotogota bacterium]|nr:M20/M25/M40 family metallo-hydrolase [Thermotogota bacterium]
MERILTKEEEQNVVELTKKFIKYPSSIWDDDKAYQYAFDYLNKKGYKPEKGDSETFSIENREGFFNVEAKFGNGKGPKILLNGHLDTVGTKGEWIYDKYGAYEDDGKIYGLGAADMKAGCAVAVQVYEAIAKRCKELNGELFLSLVYGEESPHSIGTDELLKQYGFDNYDLIIVTEPSPELTKDNYCLTHEKLVKNPEFPVVVVGAEGREKFEIQFYGRESHASHPKRGLNALHDASRVITELISFNKFSDIKTGRGDYVVLNIEGGDESFTVPGFCKVTINRQLGINEKPSAVEKEIRRIIKSLHLKTKVRLMRKYSPSEDVEYRPYLSKNNKYFDKLFEIIEAYNPGNKTNKCRFISTSIGDFNLFGVRTKLPTLVFGPGGGNIHSANEFVNKQEIIDSAEYLAKWLLDIYGIKE